MTAVGYTCHLCGQYVGGFQFHRCWQSGQPIIPSVSASPTIDDIRRVVREEIEKALAAKAMTEWSPPGGKNW